MRLIIFFVAIALAAGAFVLTSQFTTKPAETGLPIVQPQIIVQDVPTVDIYMARQDISIGTIIKPEMLDIQPYPKNLLLEDMVQADPNTASNIVKMVARTPFQKGEPLFMSKLGNEKDPSFLAAGLPKGMRVVTIAVDTVSGVGNFVYPGDRVDVLITHDVTLEKYKLGSDAPAASQAEAIKKDPVTEVLLSNIKVLAVNQKSMVKANEPPAPLTNVSIEVSAVDAQKLRLTENGNGRLSLALRSLKDKDENELARPTGLSDLSRLTPPAYFPVLYNNTNAGNTASTTETPETPATAADAGLPVKSFVNVVRGVKAESVEVSQP
jgi:pilus assembly protein CpaB